MLLFYWSSFYDVCPNYEVVMFQPWTGTPPDLGFVANCFVAMLIIPTLPFPPATQYPPRKDTRYCPFPISISDHLVPTQYQLPNRESLVFVSSYKFTSFPELESANSSPPPPFPRLLNFRCHALAVTKISSNIALIYC